MARFFGKPKNYDFGEQNDHFGERQFFEIFKNLDYKNITILYLRIKYNNININGCFGVLGF